MENMLGGAYEVREPLKLLTPSNRRVLTSSNDHKSRSLQSFKAPVRDVGVQVSEIQHAEDSCGMASARVEGLGLEGSHLVSNDEAEDHAALLRMRLEAMTWASTAKDSMIIALTSRLRNALEIAKMEQDRNQKLEQAIQLSLGKTENLIKNFQDAKLEISKLEQAEERLAVQLGDLEVEMLHEHHAYQSQIRSLKARLQDQENYIRSSLSRSEGIRHSAGESPNVRAEPTILDEDLKPPKVSPEIVAKSLRRQPKSGRNHLQVRFPTFENLGTLEGKHFEQHVKDSSHRRNVVVRTVKLSSSRMQRRHRIRLSLFANAV